ncbi:hydroxymethylglutaryl-CoA reductase, degradative [Borrelia crocidurae]|uniref:3-hydroxy-3-methylglutaryl coenzyme A reductase n=1 Tax=Borrelia crocidurae (strain Achema) TaxID=1155096 RepID=I0FDB7_BORCA|nr:hydroxymethylglutaryl-CoA reductase, degradative [Borrelia crocidurae]AFI31473.1 3-hydroxy-3-methylglutaryl-CoA reductase [Borrelia crocidurae str. Achema]
MKLSDDFRNKSILDKKREIKDLLKLNFDDFFYDSIDENFLSHMIENYIGYLSLPVGIVKNLKVNDKYYSVPIATEEPSVIAALNFAAKILETANLSYSVGEVLGIAQVYISTDKDLSDILLGFHEKIDLWSKSLLKNMELRGGGFRRLSTKFIEEIGIQKLNIYIDVCDVMGSNLLNSVAEKVAHNINLEFGYKCVLKILSNDSNDFSVKANFKLNINNLLKNNEESLTLAHNISLISKIGFFEEERAITNNKGIMNGITGLCVATLNDTRALEASIHKFASRSGRYLPLSKFYVFDENLVGEIELPLQVGVKGGSVGSHEASMLSFKIMGIDCKKEFMGILACVGLSSNFAALRALAFDGIQRGHMRLHVNKILYLLERDYNVSSDEKEKILLNMNKNGIYSIDFALKFLNDLRA